MTTTAPPASAPTEEEGSPKDSSTTVIEVFRVGDDDDDDDATSPSACCSRADTWCLSNTRTASALRNCCGSYWVFFPASVLLAILLLCVIGFGWSFFIDEDGNLARNILISTLIVGAFSAAGLVVYTVTVCVYMMCYGLGLALISRGR
jgi:hypothetical protein